MIILSPNILILLGADSEITHLAVDPRRPRLIRNSSVAPLRGARRRRNEINFANAIAERKVHDGPMTKFAKSVIRKPAAISYQMISASNFNAFIQAPLDAPANAFTQIDQWLVSELLLGAVDSAGNRQIHFR
jgi:hypothetical protein